MINSLRVSPKFACFRQGWGIEQHWVQVVIGNNWSSAPVSIWSQETQKVEMNSEFGSLAGKVFSTNSNLGNLYHRQSKERWCKVVKHRTIFIRIFWFEVRIFLIGERQTVVQVIEPRIVSLSDQIDELINQLSNWVCFSRIYLPVSRYFDWGLNFQFEIGLTSIWPESICYRKVIDWNQAKFNKKLGTTLNVNLWIPMYLPIDWGSIEISSNHIS
jgi:hypothetical protein